MKTIILYFTLITSTLTYAQDFFDTDKIQKIELTFTQTDWDATLDTYYNSGSDFRLEGSVKLNGELFENVGVRYKGKGSYDENQIKNPLNIKLDYVHNKADIDGRNVLKLSNAFGDPSFVREVVSYEIARKYLPSSASNFAEVYVNGTYIGLYVNDESINSSFIGRHYFKSNDPYFEGETTGNTPIGCATGTPNVLGYLGTDQTCYEQFYTIKSNNTNDWNDLILALDTFNNYTTKIDNAFYIDRLLWMLAFDNVMVNLDAPISTPENFSIYKDNTDRFNPILWDLNESFGSDNNLFSITELQQLDPWYNSTNPNFSILNKPLQDERNKKMYIAKMKTIFNENINNDLYIQRATELQNLISTSINLDTNKFYSENQSAENLTNSIDGKIGLKQLMNGRKTFLNNHADFNKVAPVVSNITNSPEEEVHSNNSVTISATISNADYVYLGYRFSPKEKFTKVQMTAVGDQYSTIVNVAYADLQFYIWAENNDAGIFSPERAEYEFHRIGVTTDVVINELQSSNKSTQFDVLGAYSDWIELYNNTNATIDLTGYYLSDNKDTLTKWKIPAQSIEPDEYVIFWADKNTAEDNHTNFQLTKNGESLYLVNPSGNIIDQITYTYMPTDLSYSRYPNGRGPFMIKEPTFKADNGSDSISISIETIENELNTFSVFPNPSNSHITIQSNSKISKNSSIQIFDILGKNVFSQSFKNNEKINTSKLNSGIYFIKIDNTTLKFVKQ